MARPNTLLRIPSEHEEQVEFVSYFKKTYLLTMGVRIFAVPNGGFRGKRESQRLVSEGVDKGVPDLVVPEWFLFIEMKRIKGGYLSKEQKSYKAYLEKSGYTVLVCKGFEDAKLKVNHFYETKILPGIEYDKNS